jgi:ABC-type branched-subunit amino acid transport system substrate-binding protein
MKRGGTASRSPAVPVVGTPAMAPPRNAIRRRVLWVTALAAVAWFIGSGEWKRVFGFSSYQEIYSRRYEKALTTTTADIAVVFASGEDGLYNGIDLAFADRSVHVNGRTLKVKLHQFKTGGSAAEVKRQEAMAQSIARDDSYAAVVGHSTSEIASMASVSYEYTKLLFVAPIATDDPLTEHGFSYVFRTILTDNQYVDAVAKLCKQLHVSRVGTFYEISPHSLSAIDELKEAFSQESISTLFEKGYESSLGTEVGTEVEKRNQQERLQDQISSVEHLIKSAAPPQMIALVGDNLLAATEFWKKFSNSDLKNLPLIIYGGPLDSSDFLLGTARSKSSAGALQPKLINIDAGDLAVEPGAIYITSLFSSAELNEPFSSTEQQAVRHTSIASFVQDYAKRYPGVFPDALAMRGFSSGQILKSAFEQSNSIAPIDVQETLRSSQRTFQSLGRIFTFDARGDVSVTRLGAKSPIIYKRFSPLVAADAPQPTQ